MHIARLVAADAASYRTLMLEAYEQAADAFTSTADERAAEPLSFWVRRIAEPSGLGAAFGAFDGTALVGTVALEFSAKPKTRHKALLIGMYVTPGARGTGASAALLEAALAEARARDGLRQVTLTVTEGNDAAIRLYRRAGFEAFGVEPAAIHTPAGYRAKVHMLLPLRPAAPPAATAGDPAAVVQRQLDAYNARDVDAWLDTYAPDAEQYALHGERLARGHAEMRPRIVERFREPDLQARLLHRVVIGAVVVDAEEITRNLPEGRGTIEMLCIYEVADGRIAKASFAFGRRRLHGAPGPDGGA